MIHGYVRILACVARADGVIAPEEFSAIVGASIDVLDKRTADEVLGILNMATAVDVDAILRDSLSEIIGPEGTVDVTIAANLAEITRDCYVIAAIDGDSSAAEVAMIDRFMELAGVPEHRRPPIHRWAKAAARQTLNGATLFMESFQDRG